MSATYRSTGDRVDYTPGAAVSAGDVVVQGTLVAVATDDIAANRQGSLAVEGVFDLDKAAGTVFTAGQDVFYDATSDHARTAGGVYFGKAVEAPATGASTVRAKLIQQEAAESTDTTTNTGTLT
jgi:predicted RecA/RadA family phage recombinase